MGSALSLDDLLPVLLPVGFTDAGLCMLTAYFDDSGTHNQSEIVCWAGLFGNHAQWAALDAAWKKRLAESVPGKDSIRRAHMYDCQNSFGEYTGWNRVECDFFTRDLGQIIIDAGLWGYALGIARKAWDNEVQGERRKLLGDAEAYCFGNCIMMAERWGTVCAPNDKQLALVFDKRPHRTKRMKAVFEIFESENRREKLNLLNPRTPDLVSLTFSSAADFRPLQAADLLAWEFYQNVTNVLKGGGDVPARDHMKRLVASGRIVAQIATPETLKGVASKDSRDDEWYAELLKNAPPDWPR